jgi:hypothetical protein
MSDDEYLDDDKFVAEYLQVAKHKYEEGNKAVVLTALHQCFLMKRPVPEWLRLAFIETYESAARFEIRTWDEAFGRAQEKGVHLDARRHYAELCYPVALGVALRDPEESIDEGLFEKIGSDLRIGKTKASDVYYKFGGKELAEVIEPFVPFLRKRANSEKN